MKLFLHKIIVIVIGVSFLSAYFEFNEAEKKQNFEKESHAYAISVKQTQSHSIKQPEKNTANEFLYEFSIKYVICCKRQNQESYSSPPLTERRLFLRHSVFLIWYFSIMLF